MLKSLLIEIGVEELPAIPLVKELPSIDSKWAKILEDMNLMCKFEFYYTPRRFVLWHREFPTSQSDSFEEFYGAPLAVAYKDGEPTKAAEGFARKCGVTLDEIGKAIKGDKEVLYFKKEIKGRSSDTLLNEMINNFLQSLNFGKSMRWGSRSDSFIRPVRWLNVTLGQDGVESELFGVSCQKMTYVHRSSSFEPKFVETANDYFNVLKNGGVVLFQEERRQIIIDGFKRLESTYGVKIEDDGDLLDEVVAITENPTALIGTFDEEFLRLPPEVIITSMKEHQRYFPVFKDAKLTNQFVVVTNALTDDYSKVIEGNERVLRPRLSDALFFYDNDLKAGLSTKGLDKVVFMNGLGSMADKIEREKNIALILFDMYKDQIIKNDSLDEDRAKTYLVKSAELSKADLMSEMVYEFTELQGLMGYYYAKALGESDVVANALKEQYLPDGEQSDLPSSVISAIIALSYKLDSLLGLFSIDKIPTGSRDPFALRRAVIGILRIVLEHKLVFSFEDVVKKLTPLYASFDTEKLNDFFKERLYQFYAVNPSVILSVLGSGEQNILEIDKKISAVNSIVQGSDFKEVFSTFKRVANIIKDVNLEETLSINSKLFEEDAEIELYKAYDEVSNNRYVTYDEELEALFGLKNSLDAFFDNVMVNAEDDAVRTNRKNLIAGIYLRFKSIADIKEISV